MSYCVCIVAITIGVIAYYHSIHYCVAFFRVAMMMGVIAYWHCIHHRIVFAELP